MLRVEECIRRNGYDKNLISLIVMDAELASACAVLVPGSNKSIACNDLNGVLVIEAADFKLEVLPFKPCQFPASDHATPKSASGIFRLAISPPLPKFIIGRHIEERFAIFKPKVEKSKDHSFIVSIQSLSCAKEAVAVFNNSLLQGIQITVSFEGGLSCHKQPNMSVGAKALTSSSDYSAAYRTSEESYSYHEEVRLIETECGSVPQDSLHFVNEDCNVFVYSKPKFPDFVGREELMEHFREFKPVNAYIIKKQRRSTGTGKVIFPSKVVAEKAMKAKKGTKVLKYYTISLKFENPAYPPKPESEKSRYTRYSEDRTTSSPLLQTGYSESPQERPMVGGPTLLLKWKDRTISSPLLHTGHSERAPEEWPMVGGPVRPSKSRKEKCHYSVWKGDTSHQVQSICRDPSHTPPKSQNCYTLQVDEDRQISPFLPPSLSQTYANRQPSEMKSISSSSLKVSHLPCNVTIKKLVGLFKKFGELDGNPVIHKGRTPYAHVNFRTKTAAEGALQLNGTKFEGSQIVVKCVKSLPRMSERAGFPEFKVQAKYTTCEVMKLLPGQWNRLMMVGPVKTTLLEDMITPYKDNSNIAIQPMLAEKVLQFTGKEETVQSALKYFAVQLKRDLEIDRYV